ncbi:MAG TPA: hypothetical protein VM737_01680 [Gemmatimonadota bacterium]|nr:hypothetical protein [Gemmatimonadota bacterium]
MPVAAALLAMAAPFLLLDPAPARAQASWGYDQDVRLTYEFDDNVSEELRDPVRAQVARVAYSSDLRWGSTGEQRLSLSYQGGFKRHFGLAGSDDELASQFVNEGTVGYMRRMSDMLALGGTVGLKNRKWTDDFFFINEDGFTRVNGSVNALLTLAPLAPEQPARLEVGGRWSTISFENLDQTFGNDAWGGYAALSKQFGGDVTATTSYAIDRVHYPGRGVLEPDDTDPLNAFRGSTRPRQEDHLHELGIELTWLGNVSIQADYGFRYNDSNSFGLSYLSHNFGLQVLRRLPWGMLAQFYGQVELKAFTEPVPSLTGAGSLDTGEAANNALLVRLVKDVTPETSIEVRYGRYRNESITLNDFYTKNIYAVGMNYRP